MSASGRRRLPQVFGQVVGINERIKRSRAAGEESAGGTFRRTEADEAFRVTVNTSAEEHLL